MGYRALNISCISDSNTRFFKTIFFVRPSQFKLSNSNFEEVTEEAKDQESDHWSCLNAILRIIKFDNIN